MMDWIETGNRQHS